MSSNKTLIAYGTGSGTTAEAPSKIANISRSKYGLVVDLVNLKKSPSDLSRYKNIVIGSRVAIGR